MADELTRMEITGWREAPLYNDIKVIDGVLTYGELVGKYSIIETEGQKKNGEVIGIISPDDSMEAPVRTRVPKESEVLIKLDSHVEEGDTGIFSVNGMTVIRVLKKEGRFPILGALNEKYPDTQISEEDEFFTIGRVVEVSISYI